MSVHNVKECRSQASGSGGQERVGALYEALLGRRLERVLHHLGARVAVLLARGRVRAARGPLAARLRPQRAQRGAAQRQRQQRGAGADQDGSRAGARGTRSYHLFKQTTPSIVLFPGCFQYFSLPDLFMSVFTPRLPL